MSRQRPLGSAEKVCLQRLSARGGTWTEGEKPLWESKHWTLELLAALTIKGMVSEVKPGQEYRLTADGTAQADGLGFEISMPSPISGQTPVHFDESGSYRLPSPSRRPY
jgi:hypothetical protein